MTPPPTLTSTDARAFERCMAAGGVALFPADTVYGLACDPRDEDAFRRLYALKGRVADKPAAVLFFQADLALAELPDLGDRTRAAFARLVPGPVTLLVPNPEHRFALACGPTPEVLGVRVPALGAGAAALHEVRRAVVQSSANLSGGRDPRAVGDVAATLRDGVDLVLDAGELPGTPSTVIDLRRYEDDHVWNIVRVGALGEAEVAAALA